MIVLIILGVSAVTFLLCIWNNINFVLAILSDSLFISSHSLILKSSSFISGRLTDELGSGRVQKKAHGCCKHCGSRRRPLP